MNTQGIYATDGENTLFIYTGDEQQSIPIQDYKVILNGVEDNTALESHLTDVGFLYNAKISNEAKKIINIKITSNNANTFYAKEGDIITLTFQQTEDLDVVKVNIAGDLISYSQDGDNYTATYTVTGSTPEAVIGFSITAKGESFSKTSGSGRCTQVTVDLTKPTATITNSAFIKTEYAIGDPTYDPFTVKILWDEKIDGLAQGDLLVTGGRILRFNYKDNSYNVKISPTTDPVFLQINQGSVSDIAGNENLLITEQIDVD